jgi:hypothetical protein
MRRTILRLLSSFRSSRAETELAREIRSHLQLLEDQYIAKGMDAEEARFAALRAFGGVEQVKEHQREARMFRWLAGWPMDLKLGDRVLVKYPGKSNVMSRSTEVRPSTPPRASATRGWQPRSRNFAEE